MSSIMDIGYEENYDILFQPYFPTHARSKRKLVSLIYEHRIDGFVTTPPCDAEDFVSDLLNTYKVPLVQINPFTRPEKTPFVAADDVQGAKSMTEHLLSLGHRRIAFFMGPRNMRASFDRLTGYKAALEPINCLSTRNLCAISNSPLMEVTPQRDCCSKPTRAPPRSLLGMMKPPLE